MSIKVLNNVWDYSQCKGSMLLLLLAIADNAREESGVAWPGIEYLAEKTRLSQRQVIRLIKKIEDVGEMEVRRSKAGNTYWIKVWGDEIPYRYCRKCGVLQDYRNRIELHEHHIIPKSEGGSDDPENLITLCPICHRRIHSKDSDKMSHDKLVEGDMYDVFKVTLDDDEVTSGVMESDIAMSPEPLLTNINKPLYEPSNNNDGDRWRDIDSDPVPVVKELEY